MVKIEAILRPEKVDEVKAALDEIGVKGMTVIPVMGAGKQRGRTQYYRQQQYVKLLEKKKLETVVVDSMADRVVETIIRFASTGTVGDGKIFLTRVDDAVRIRTGERGEVALG